MKKSDLPFLIAEISANHCGKISIAKKLIKCAKINGANAVKLQTYTADSMTIKSSKKYFRIKDGLWSGYQLWDLYNEAHTPIEWHQELFNYAKQLGITIFSTPFDETSVDLLEQLKCPIYKIASFEMIDIPLVKKVASLGKPMIISTGMANLKEIDETYEAALKAGAKDITLLYCVSNYPSTAADYNLNNIKIFKERYGCRVGLSDHSKDELIACSAIASGAEVIEKHIALENQTIGLDIEFSLKGKEIRNFRNSINKTKNLMGKNYFFRNKSEDSSRKLRRSIYVVKDIKKNEKFSKKNIRCIRPGNGLLPKYFEKIISKKSPRDLKTGEPLQKNILIDLKIK
tara:strand:+ start:1691 stop:2722 length:1032 start_codon:yes stop_codon:yes gene_type:complete